jgi:hypothetical protein
MITTGAKDLAGIALENTYVWTFQTAVITSPTVSSTDPANAATGVVLNKQITATFSKTMDASTITTATFTLMQGAAFLAGTVSYVGTSATFIPSSNLTSNTSYTVTITTGAQDLAGNALAKNYVWSFTTAVITSPTVSSTDPVNAATGVALNQKIAATFSKTMDASTITASTFTLMQGTTQSKALYLTPAQPQFLRHQAILHKIPHTQQRLQPGLKILQGMLWQITMYGALQRAQQ